MSNPKTQSAHYAEICPDLFEDTDVFDADGNKIMVDTIMRKEGKINPQTGKPYQLVCYICNITPYNRQKAFADDRVVYRYLRADGTVSQKYICEGSRFHEICDVAELRLLLAQTICLY